MITIKLGAGKVGMPRASISAKPRCHIPPIPTWDNRMEVERMNLSEKRSWIDMELLLNDVRLGARTLLRTPGFASIAILVIALGISANVALFAIVRSVLLNPLPYADPSRLVRLYEHVSVGGVNSPYSNSAAGIYAEWKQHNQTLSDIAIAGSTNYNLSSAGEQLPEVVHAGNLSWNTLPLLGVRPAFGRNFTADDDKPGANPTVLLSWGLWKRRFGGDPAIVYKTILLDAVPHTVIGVMPPSFSFSGPSFTSLSHTGRTAVDAHLPGEKNRPDEDAR